MNIINAAQGSAEWLAIRAKHFTASEAPAMMGESKYQTRQELLRQKHTGIAADVDANTQRVFDRGHEAEAAARPIVEGIIGAELFPATGAQEVDGLPLLASFDGLTMLEDTVWENKLFNAGLADQMRAGQLEPHYYWQIEQQLLVSGADRAYFTTSDGTQENTIGMWYASYPERRAKLIAGWKQFAADLADYQHVESASKPTAAVIESLPALVVQVEGRVLSTNLDAFKAKAQTFIDSIKTSLATDQDFADAEQMVKFLKDGEDKLDLAKQQALAQTASIDELFRTVDAISAQMKTKRLALDKLVKAEKENRKSEIVSNASDELKHYINNLNGRIGGNWMPYALFTAARFAEVIKGLKSLDSMRDKVSTALAHAKIEANEIADTIEENRSAVPDEMLGLLFPDFAQVCAKPREDFAGLLAMRVAAHREAEEKRAEAERIRKEAEGKQIAPQVTLDHSKKAGDVIPPQAVAAKQETDVDASAIDDFIRLLPIGLVEKKALRPHLLAWEKYRVAREMAVAA